MQPRVIIYSFLPFAMLIAVTVAGCSEKPPKPRRDYEFPATQPTYNQAGNAVWSTRRDDSWQERPIGGIQQKPTIIKEGLTPLVQILDLGGPIRVVDLTSNTAIATAVAPPQSLVRIDDVH